MIVFHEGLPGAGKSYEACIFHILPALQQGRRVVTNIEGIDHAKFAEITGIPEKMLLGYLVCVYDHDAEIQKKKLLEESQKDSLVVIDEIQNLFPSTREKLDEAWNKYISEHRHEGLDIILMGQDRRDCHNMWRRRIQRVIVFKKQTALGRNDAYAWACLEATGPDKFKQVTAGSRKYDAKYFGLYASFTDGTGHKTVYTDKRATVWNHWGFKFGIPAFLLALVFSGLHLYQFFNPSEEPKPQQRDARVTARYSPEKTAQVAPSASAAQSNNEQEPERAPVDVFDEMAAKYRLRLAGLVYSPGGDPSKLFAYVDVLDDSFHLKDRWTVSELRDMGWSVTKRDSGLFLEKLDVHYVARAWPIDKPGRIDNDTRSTLAGAERRAAGPGERVAASYPASGPTVHYVPDSTPYPNRTH